MALGDYIKGAIDIGKAMGVTLKHLAEKPVTTERGYGRRHNRNDR